MTRILLATLSAAFLPCLAEAQQPTPPPQPLHFEPVSADPDAGFVARGGGTRMEVRREGLMIALPGGRATMRLSGSHGAAALVPEAPTGTLSNYYVGPREQWRTGVPHHDKVRAEHALPGVDLVYYAVGRRLEFDVVLEPGVRADSIRMQWEGARDLRIDERGRLRLTVGEEEMHLEPPLVYQQLENRVAVDCRYRMLADGTVGFALGAYDDDATLVIDPILTFSTLLGGSSLDRPVAVDMNDVGGMTVIGYTTSADFPVASAFQPGYIALQTVFVTAYSPSHTVLFSTYLGSNDVPVGVKIGSNGAIYVAGTTFGNYPTTLGAPQTMVLGTSDFFCSQLSPTGQLLWSTYLGGGGSDTALDLELSPEDFPYILGQSNGGYPVHPAAYSTRGDGTIVASLTNFGQLGISTNIGITAQGPATMALGPFGNVYVVGRTRDPNLPTSTFSYQQSLQGTENAFVLQLLKTLDLAGWASYIGNMTVYDVVIQPDRIVSDNRPTLLGMAPPGVTIKNPLPGTASTTSGTYLSQLSGDGQRLNFATFVPWAQRNLSNLAIDQDDAGNLYVLGGSSVNPLLVNNYWRGFGQQAGGWLGKLDKDATQVLYSTVIAGKEHFGVFVNDTVADLAVNGSGEALVTGETGATHFETTAGAPQTTVAGQQDGFLVRFSADSFEAYGQGTIFNPPVLSGAGDLQPGGVVRLRLRDITTRSGQGAILLLGAGRAQIPFSPFFDIVVANPIVLPLALQTAGVRYGLADLNLPIPNRLSVSGVTLNAQAIVVTGTSLTASRGVEFTIQ